ncbi:outer membrane protein assembly factor BamB family protein [Novipirellula artificiosorum]|uniref:Outer membrane protein assembly factor BamB n=1 Tax=Novipirellula artificiosorum TaxID=2528016 RepID=A0A5C6DHD8_9BACT|nr:PQQ-binding-like beta-propeller repeat protein [Novipirellula artificiosorum]TWU34369.1 Outer membrane protein assembly factor BamB [Novipirellula artificiosorum]
MNTNAYRLFVACLLGCLTTDLGRCQADWECFLNGGRPITDAGEVPMEWSTTQNIAWKTPIPGYGQSSPVLWQDRVYVTSVEGENKEQFHLTAIRITDGNTLWTKSFAASTQVKNSYYTSRAAPTPAVDSNGVYVFFESGDCVSIDHSGQTRWQRSLTKDYGDIEAKFGLGASPGRQGSDEAAARESNLAIRVNHMEGQWEMEVDWRVRGPMAEEATEERRAAAASFAGPIQYAAIATKGSILVRTGPTLYCIRETKP